MMLRRVAAPGPIFLGAAIVLSLWVAADSAPIAGDVGTARWVQDRSWYEGIADAVNPLGGVLSWVAPALAALVIVAIGRIRSRPVWGALDVILAAVVLRAASPVLKELVQSPRPSASYGIEVTEIRDNFGFPSGHVYATVLVYGSIAWALGHVAGREAATACWVVAAVAFVLAGPSRIFVGAHWPSDVVGGYLWGAAALSAALAVGRAVSRPPRSRPATQRAGPGRSARDG